MESDDPRESSEIFQKYKKIFQLNREFIETKNGYLSQTDVDFLNNQAKITAILLVGHAVEELTKVIKEKTQ